jgi:hypothetical protein
MFCGRNFSPLATLPTMPQIAHRHVHATGEKGCRQEQNRRRQSKINPQKQFAPRHVNSQSGVHFQMRSRLSIYMLNFEYEDDSKM